jgi:hypothetical protein
VDSLGDLDELPTNQLQMEDDEPIINDGFLVDDLQNSSASRQPCKCNETYEHYLDLVLTNGVGFYQIAKTLFVVQGWDTKANTATVGVQLLMSHHMVELEGLVSRAGLIFSERK